MEWQELRWNVPLESRPIILQIGANTHGREAEEQFVLPDLWCLHLYEYEAEIEIDGQRMPIRPGYVGITPPGSHALYHFFGRSPHYYAHFSIAPAGPVYPVPVMKDLGAGYGEMVDDFSEAMRFWSINRNRLAVRLWDILWELAEVSQQPPPGSGPTTIAQVLNYIDTHLHEPLHIQRLAEENGISHNHFTRLFRAAQGCTPREYIQHRRVSQAKHLLTYSAMPVKSIAASIGISDMQVFNKFIRHYLGRSPRALRTEEAPKVGLLE